MIDQTPDATLQQPAQATKDEKRGAKKKKRARRISTLKRFTAVSIVVLSILTLLTIMNNFDSVVGRNVIMINEKYMYEGGKGYAIVDANGFYYWLSKEDWDSCSIGEEVKLYTSREGSSFIETDRNLLREMFE